MIGLLERQIQKCNGTRVVWCGRITERIKTILKATIENKWEERIERTEGYFNDEEALRREFGMDPEVDRSEATGGLEDPGRGHVWRGPQWDQGADLGVLDDVALLREPADAPSQVEETGLEEGNAHISIL